MTIPAADAQLNANQQKAAQLPPGPVLIIAGPGSGKTRVLTHRIANLISMHNVPSRHILAMTFTNAAAAELKQRAIAMAPASQHDLTVGTFHSFCSRQLRRLGSEAGHRTDFMIADRADQLEFVKHALEYHKINPRDWKPSDVLSKISSLKTALNTPADLQQQIDAGQRQHDINDEIVPVYATYQRFLRNANVLDFDDMIVNTVRVLRQHEPSRRRLNNQYRHILIDEFQDTDPAQYELCRLLTNHQDDASICVVGDPDQSIYGWRNARIQNILDFQNDYPNVTTVTLDVNYRSTPQIVAAAKDIIGNNTQRIDHQLVATNGSGSKVAYAVTKDEHDQAETAVNQLRDDNNRQNASWDSAAILFRTNRQSRAIEEECVRQGVPYRLLGGTPFYQRAEIKHVLAYLRMLHNPADTVSFQRAVNLPPRRIGPHTIQAIMAEAMETGQTPVQVAVFGWRPSQETLGLKKGALAAIARFEEIHQTLTEFMENASVHALATKILESTGLDQHIKSMENGPERWENVTELLELCKEYGQATAVNGLTAMLDRITLVDQSEAKDEEEPTITLCTLHKAKGTEFPNVAIVGMYEGSIPHGNTDDPEEERRLCYVGVTRAADNLTLLRPSYAYGRQTEPSRYLDEISDIEEIDAV